jgi:hypothetical protein
MLGYCFDLIGKERPTKGSPDRVFLENPVVILQLPKGGDSGVDTTLKMMDRAGKLEEMIFIIEKSIPAGDDKYRIQLKDALTEAEYLKRVGSQVNLDLPPEALKIKDLSTKEVGSLIIRSFREVDFDALSRAGIDLPEVTLYPKSAKSSSGLSVKSELEND